MSQESNHKKQFNANDIRRYYAGEMNASEMHALERAALEDPFLADAMEGYQTVPASQAKADLEELGSRLNEKTSGKLVPILSTKRNWYWYAAAAVLILFAAGGGWYLMNRSEISNAIVVQQDKAKVPATVAPDTSFKNDEYKRDTANELTESIKEAQKDFSASVPQEKSKVDKNNKSPKPATAPSSEALKVQDAPSNPAEISNEVALDKAKAPEREESKKRENDDEFSKKAARSAPQVSAASGNAQGYITTRLIAGRVISKNGRALPFVNMQVNNDRNLIYTNAAGEFKIFSGDTALDVQVKSIGYQDKKARISANTQANTIILDSLLFDEKAKVKNAIKNSLKTDSLLRVESEAEPVDGWTNYDIYVDNNLRIPGANQPGIHSGIVELSFMVYKNGTLSGFKIERGLDAASDREAIRVVKEGPKWQITSGDEPVRVSLMIIF